MDFKGRFRFDDVHATPCFPLTVLDDHSRFCIALRACRNRKRETVHHHLTDAFRRYVKTCFDTRPNHSRLCSFLAKRGAFLPLWFFAVASLQAVTLLEATTFATEETDCSFRLTATLTRSVMKLC